MSFTTRCRRCRHRVHRYEAVCQHCGELTPGEGWRRRRNVRVFLILAVSLAALVVCFELVRRMDYLHGGLGGGRGDYQHRTPGTR